MLAFKERGSCFQEVNKRGAEQKKKKKKKIVGRDGKISTKGEKRIGKPEQGVFLIKKKRKGKKNKQSGGKGERKFESTVNRRRGSPGQKGGKGWVWRGGGERKGSTLHHEKKKRGLGFSQGSERGRAK